MIYYTLHIHNSRLIHTSSAFIKSSVQTSTDTLTYLLTIIGLPSIYKQQVSSPKHSDRSSAKLSVQRKIRGSPSFIMCFSRSSHRDRRDRSLSPPPRPARRSRHSQEDSHPISSSNRRRKRQQEPGMTTHHPRRSSTLVFEGEPSTAQTPRRRSGKARSRSRRHGRSTKIRDWAADIPEDVEHVEDSDPPVESLTRSQGKQPELKVGDRTTKGEAKEQNDLAGRPPVYCESQSETKKTTENRGAKRSMAGASTAEPLEKKIPESSKAAAARKLPETKTTGDILGSKASEISETIPPPAPDPPGSSASAPPPPVINKPAPDTTKQIDPSSVLGSSGGNK